MATNYSILPSPAPVNENQGAVVGTRPREKESLKLNELFWFVVQCNARNPALRQGRR